MASLKSPQSFFPLLQDFVAHVQDVCGPSLADLVSDDRTGRDFYLLWRSGLNSFSLRAFLVPFSNLAFKSNVLFKGFDVNVIVCDGAGGVSQTQPFHYSAVLEIEARQTMLHRSAHSLTGQGTDITLRNFGGRTGNSHGDNQVRVGNNRESR
jgi:hypothetical protein